MVLVDQDAAGPGGSDQMSLMVLLQSPNTQVLGITVVTGDAWRDEEVQHTLRMLEVIGRTDVPVVPARCFRWCARRRRPNSPPSFTAK